MMRLTISLWYIFLPTVYPLLFSQKIKKILGPETLLLENTVRPEYITELMGANRYFLQINMLRFECDEISTNGKDLIFPLMLDDAIENSRQTERYSFAPFERVNCEILNPYDKVTWLKKRVMDMSSTGMCISSSFDSALFQPATFFPELKVIVDKDSFFTTSGSVIYVRKYMPKEGRIHNQIGIKFLKEVPTLFS